jgi:ATP-dependent DNA helicase DinG
MQDRPPATTRPQALLAGLPALVAGIDYVGLALPGEVPLELPTAAALAHLRTLPPPLVVHTVSTLRRLRLRSLPCLDLLELFAFVVPAATVAPTPAGLARALGLDPPASGLGAAAASLHACAETLLARLLAAATLPANRNAAALAREMGRDGWGWAEKVAACLPPSPADAPALAVWRRLPEWQETAPPPPPGSEPVPPADARRRLAAMLGPQAEARPGQSDYAAAVASAFAARDQAGDPHFVLAEAGTGTGKTLGYIAPASLWAERNRGPVWISTYTRHLQRQVEAELARLYPDRQDRSRRVVVRKGRENYLCLLNYEGAVLAAPTPGRTVGLGLIARWALASRDGDLQGGDLPGWFAELFGPGLLAELADRRGECIHAACPHWRRCFVEHSIRRAHNASLVVANHALVMAQAAWGGIDDDFVPSHYVFDEGHHVFDAADGAFATELTAAETMELRRWLLGAEGGRSRARGLRRRLDDLTAGRPALEEPLQAALHAAAALPAPGWSAALTAIPGLEESNPTQAFLAAARTQVLARNRATGEASQNSNSEECDALPASPALLAASVRLAATLDRLASPLRLLCARLEARLSTEAATLDSPSRNRIEAACRSLRRRAIDRLAAWQEMLRELGEPPREPGERPQHVLFLRLDRRDGRESDIGLHRHWLDPTLPFVATLARQAQGILVTSATLRDLGEGDAERQWAVAEERVGAPHLPSPAIRVAVTSPFDYARQTRALVVNDLDGRENEPLAAAFETLFLASGGGGLGLFTAIARLRLVAARIGPRLARAGIQLFAQHVDPMNNTTLVEVFRAEENSCLLGTDAMRDGVDVPGPALRLVVFERVPWPRPDILHRERRTHLSGGDPKGFDDAIVRLRLRQAFGRLIRSSTDRGVFVLLDRRTPSRLLTALPPEVTPVRLGLAEAVAEVSAFLR